MQSLKITDKRTSCFMNFCIYLLLEDMLINSNVHITFVEFTFLSLNLINNSSHVVVINLMNILQRYFRNIFHNFRMNFFIQINNFLAALLDVNFKNILEVVSSFNFFFLHFSGMITAFTSYSGEVLLKAIRIFNFKTVVFWW